MLDVSDDSLAFLVRHRPGANHLRDPLINRIAFGPGRAAAGEHMLISVLRRFDLEKRTGIRLVDPHLRQDKVWFKTIGQINLHAAVPVVGGDGVVSFDDVAGNVRPTEVGVEVGTAARFRLQNAMRDRFVARRRRSRLEVVVDDVVVAAVIAAVDRPGTKTVPL